MQGMGELLQLTASRSSPLEMVHLPGSREILKDMARSKRSLFQRVLVQTDCAFWCIHDNLSTIGLLALPTLGVVVALGLGLIQVLRTWNLETDLNVLLVFASFPVLAFCFTLLPLPCAVFAWRAVEGQTATVGECFGWCFQKSGRLISVMIRLGLIFLASMLLGGIPLLWAWPRICLTPVVALFESGRRIFQRSQRLLRADLSIASIGFLYICMGLVLGGLVILPRLVLGTPMLGANLLDAKGQRLIVEYLWIFETISIAILLTGIAVTWWMSLTLIYADIRGVREGDNLRRRIAAYRVKHMV